MSSASAAKARFWIDSHAFICFTSHVFAADLLEGSISAAFASSLDLRSAGISWANAGIAERLANINKAVIFLIYEKNSINGFRACQ